MQPAENVSASLFVRRISLRGTSSDFRELFSPFGKLAKVSLPFSKQTGKPSGFGFVEFASVESAVAACKALDGAEFFGSCLRVKWHDGRNSNHGVEPVPRKRVKAGFGKEAAGDEARGQERSLPPSYRRSRSRSPSSGRGPRARSLSRGRSRSRSPPYRSGSPPRARGMLLDQPPSRYPTITGSWEPREATGGTECAHMATGGTELYIQHLDVNTTELQLRSLAQQFGLVERVTVACKPRNIMCRFGFVVFKSADDAAKACKALHGSIFLGRRLAVKRQVERRKGRPSSFSGLLIPSQAAQVPFLHGELDRAECPTGGLPNDGPRLACGLEPSPLAPAGQGFGASVGQQAIGDTVQAPARAEYDETRGQPRSPSPGRSPGPVSRGRSPPRLTSLRGRSSSGARDRLPHSRPPSHSRSRSDSLGRCLAPPPTGDKGGSPEMAPAPLARSPPGAEPQGTQLPEHTDPERSASPSAQPPGAQPPSAQPPERTDPERTDLERRDPERADPPSAQPLSAQTPSAQPQTAPLVRLGFPSSDRARSPPGQTAPLVRFGFPSLEHARSPTRSSPTRVPVLSRLGKSLPRRSLSPPRARAPVLTRLGGGEGGPARSKISHPLPREKNKIIVRNLTERTNEPDLRSWMRPYVADEVVFTHKTGMAFLNFADEDLAAAALEKLKRNPWLDGNRIILDYAIPLQPFSKNKRPLSPCREMAAAFHARQRLG